MKKTLWCTVAVFALVTAGAWGQARKQPQPKSQKEVDAIIAIQDAQNADERIKASEELLRRFADTEFKEFALQMQTLSYQEKNDFENMIIAGERTLEINGENVVVLIAMAQALPQRTREHDLDREEKLGKAEQYAKKAQTLIPNLEKFNAEIPDETWADYKKGAMAQVHEALGLVALTRKNYPAAEASFKQAVDLSPQPDGMTLYRLGTTYAMQNKHDEAIATLEKSVAAGGVRVGARDLAAEAKAASEKAKASGGGAAEGTSAGGPPQVEIKRP
jgi:tetratricopeptide (TPR) repeat protein